MIIDSNLVLFEGKLETKEGSPIALNSLLLPGKVQPVLIETKFTENAAGLTNIKLELQHSDTQNGTYTTIGGMTETILLADAIVGNKVAWKYLPRTATKSWLKLKMTVSGTATAGKLFCAISGFVDEPYEAGQYFNKGENVG